MKKILPLLVASSCLSAMENPNPTKPSSTAASQQTGVVTKQTSKCEDKETLHPLVGKPFVVFDREKEDFVIGNADEKGNFGFVRRDPYSAIQPDFVNYAIENGGKVVEVGAAHGLSIKLIFEQQKNYYNCLSR